MSEAEWPAARSSKSAGWWRGAAIYQIYPRSFDTDLKGIAAHLDYITSLGVDAVWICPFFKSPMKDYGYDVSDYRDVDPMFGTLDDFKTLLSKAHDLGLKIIIDLVLSHTSDQHPWFTQKPEYYVWADPLPDMFGANVPPNNWVSVFGGSAWEWHEGRQQYYLHNFLKEQPDLNYHNPDVQQEVLDILKFWLDMGVDGFRLDVINFLFHDKELRNNPPRPPELGAATQFEGDDPYSQQSHIYDKSRPENLDFIHRLRMLMDQYEDRFTVGEIGDDHPYDRAAEYTEGNQYLNTSYNMHLMSGARKELTASLIRDPVETFAKAKGGSWPSWAFSNHDVVRAASRWLPDSDGFDHDPAFSKMLIALLGALRGTIFLYQGEELGLPEAKLAFEDLQDPWGKRLWPHWQGRDGCRTPMPWSKNTPRKQWLPVPDEHIALNAADQEKNKDSTLNFIREFLKWRKTQPALVLGDIEFIDTQNKKLLTFKRKSKEQTLICFFNLGDEPIPLPASLHGLSVQSRFTEVDHTHKACDDENTIKPYGFSFSEIDADSVADLFS